MSILKDEINKNRFEKKIMTKIQKKKRKQNIMDYGFPRIL